ncbi:MAG: CDP-diacylglycerol--serine O-phosphatidyltransferase [Bacteroidetes bacterium]|nr:CDP-diacylglycerol--serine O-phosphatidyltransferase [Bacteroidota bacterium]
MRIRLSRSIVPNLFTVLNIYFGFLSIISAAQDQFVPALWYIVLSAICDSLDGLMARLTNSASDFGVELDSLADVVGFGVAPSFLVYSLVLHDWGTLGILVSAAPLIMGALRLARFNVQLVGFSKDYFTGMPIPLSALTLVSYVLYFSPEAIQTQETLQYGLMALTATCGTLMISTVRYPVVPSLTPRGFRDHPVLMLLFVAAALIAIVSQGTMLFPALLLLIVSGPIFSAGRKLRATVQGKNSVAVQENGLQEGSGQSDARDERGRQRSQPDDNSATMDSST